MNLYVVRHGEAVESGVALLDEWRWLTPRGRKQADVLAKRLHKRGLKTCLIVSSPLARALQTAQIMAERLGRKCRLEVSGLLAPGVDREELVELLHTRGGVESLVLVGHDPQLGELIDLLLGQGSAIHLKKGACFALEFDPADEGSAAFVSYTVPGRKTVTSLKKAGSL
ncbi:MAG TPA: phosphohistidine phosphatase SixA [Deltaproteobacteria bacterium]|nr:phosphohistidine phosphatase SixA [Deltaproteobacteria bacterium]HQB39096.1 phosphohistidine phosphatase SixA [Deltaproteobacteria bacterium]